MFSVYALDDQLADRMGAAQPVLDLAQLCFAGHRAVPLLRYDTAKRRSTIAGVFAKVNDVRRTLSVRVDSSTAFVKNVGLASASMVSVPAFVHSAGSRK